MPAFNQKTVILITGPQCSGKHRMLYRVLAGMDAEWISRKTTDEEFVRKVDALATYVGPQDHTDIAPMTYQDNYWAIDVDVLDASLMVAESMGHTPVMVIHPDQITRMKVALLERGYRAFLVYCSTPESIRRTKLVNRMAVGVSAGEVQQAMRDLLDRVDYLYGAERTFQCRFSWDHINTSGKLEDLKEAIRVHNRRAVA